MDSKLKSAVVGRLAGPIFQIIAIVLFVGWGIEIDPETKEMGVNLVTTALSVVSQFWAIVMPIYSKIKESNKCS